MDFEEYYNENCLGAQKFYCAYRGIRRKEYPRWQGWDYIDDLKGTVNVSEIDCEFLDLLVENFHLIRYIGLTYYQDSLIS